MERCQGVERVDHSCWDDSRAGALNDVDPDIEGIADSPTATFPDMATRAGDSGWRGRSIQEVIPRAQELVDLVEESFPVEVSGDDRVAGYAAAYLARAAALLRSMVVLASAEDRESIPIVYRVLFETWLFGVYLVRGREDVLDVLGEHLNFEQGRIARALSLPEPDEDSSTRLSVQTVADRVREQLGDQFPTRAYDNHYRIASFHWSHGHLGALTHFFDEGPNGPQVEAQRVDPDSLSSSTLFLAMSVSLVAGLANVAASSGLVPLNLRQLAEFIDEWMAQAESV